VCGFESSACAPRHTSQRQPANAFTMASFERHAMGRCAGVKASPGQSATVPDAKTPATCPHPFHDSAILAQGKALLTNRAAQPDGLWALSMLCRGTDVACLSKPLLRGELAFAGMAQRSRMFSPLNTLIC
jgi:hypothetical protein